MPPEVSETLRIVRDPAALAELRGLFDEYRRWLNEHREVTDFDDAIQRRGDERFAREITDLPGEYGPPGGALFLACLGSDAIGCAALRRLSDGTAEMKRLFVRPGHRGRSVGRKLVEVTVDRARELGYERLVLDTLPRMESAAALYRRMGFRSTAAYWDNPVPGALFFELPLIDRGGPR